MELQRITTCVVYSIAAEYIIKVMILLGGQIYIFHSVKKEQWFGAPVFDVSEFHGMCLIEKL